MDVTHNWSSPSCQTAEGSCDSNSIIRLKYTPSTFKSYEISFTGFIIFAKNTFSLPSTIANRDQEDMYFFFLYWLNNHVIPNKSKQLKLKWIPLVEALYSIDDVATRPFLLAHLYHLLFEMTRGEPFETNLNKPTWMVQLWLQW